MDFDVDVTVVVEPGEVVLKPGKDAWKVKIANWDGLTGELQQIVTANATQAEHYALVHWLNTMLAGRQPPATYNYWIWRPQENGSPPVKLCPVALPVFVFFPPEAEFKAWIRGDYGDCQAKADCSAETDLEDKCQDSAAAVCPNRALYDEYVIEGFLTSLANCESAVKTLRVRGFASSSGLRERRDEDDLRRLDKAFTERDLSACEGVADSEPRNAPSHSQKFNLLMAEARARNVANVLSSVAGNRVAVNVEPVVWCSYADMESARKVIDNEDGPYDGFKGMLNRRAEIVVE